MPVSREVGARLTLRKTGVCFLLLKNKPPLFWVGNLLGWTANHPSEKGQFLRMSLRRVLVGNLEDAHELVHERQLAKADREVVTEWVVARCAHSDSNLQKRLHLGHGNVMHVFVEILQE